MSQMLFLRLLQPLRLLNLCQRQVVRTTSFVCLLSITGPRWLGRGLRCLQLKWCTNKIKSPYHDLPLKTLATLSVNQAGYKLSSNTTNIKQPSTTIRAVTKTSFCLVTLGHTLFHLFINIIFHWIETCSTVYLMQLLKQKYHGNLWYSYIANVGSDKLMCTNVMERNNSTTFSRLFFSTWPGSEALLSRDLEGALHKFWLIDAGVNTCHFLNIALEAETRQHESSTLQL